MSWIVGLVGEKLSQTEIDRIRRIHSQTGHEVREHGLYLAAGGYDLTLRTASLPSTEPEGWIAVGTGLRCSTDRMLVLSPADWSNFLATETPEFADIGGHYAVIRWKSNRLTCFTDPLGLRSLYFVQANSLTALSTRLDWICQWSGKSDLSFDRFGSHWMTFNQLGCKSLVEGVHRIGPGGFAVYNAGTLKIKEQPWSPRSDRSTDEEILPQLQCSLNPVLKNRTLSLGLSGGLDSRTLLALLTTSGHPFSLHVFGPGGDPDVQISKKIAEENGLPHLHIDNWIPDAGILTSKMEENAGLLCATVPASTVIKSQGYDVLNANGKMLIDGGFGEIARRQFFNRLLRRGSISRILSNPALLLPYVRVQRGEFFQPDVLETMRSGVAEDLRSLLDIMPPLDEIGAENFADLLAVRTRLPNFYGYEQARLDGVILNYMPFAQPSFLRAVFETPITLRRNGRLFRRFIRSFYPALTRYPLVKGGTTYPYRFSTIPALLWTKARAYSGKKFVDPTPVRFLKVLEEYVRDLHQSQDTAAYSPYDYKKITLLIERFYAGETALAGQVDWWIAFETWRRSLTRRF